MAKRIVVVVAMDSKRGIGKNNQVPWHLPNEYKHFVKVSKSTVDADKKNAVVMGRSTWESIPEKFRPLKGRLNLVLSRTLKKADLPEGVLLEQDIESAIKTLNSGIYKDLVESIVVAGGENIYKEFIDKNLVDVIYLTKVEGDFQCEVFFPTFDENIFQEIFVDNIPKEIQEENNIRYSFHVYTKEGVPL